MLGEWKKKGLKRRFELFEHSVYYLKLNLLLFFSLLTDYLLLVQLLPPTVTRPPRHSGEADTVLPHSTHTRSTHTSRMDTSWAPGNISGQGRRKKKLGMFFLSISLLNFISITTTIMVAMKCHHYHHHKPERKERLEPAVCLLITILLMFLYLRINYTHGTETKTMANDDNHHEDERGDTDYNWR